MTTEDKLYSPDYDPQSQRFDRKEGKNRRSLIALSVALAIFVIVSGLSLFYLVKNDKTNKQEYALIQNDNLRLTEQLSQRDSIVNEWVSTFNEIEKDLSEVKQKENIISLKSSDPELTASKREEVLEDIRYINSLLAENKRRVKELSGKLKNSGLKITSLEKIIADLNTSITERNSSIDSLKLALVDREFQMAEMNVKLEDMASEIGNQKSTIESQINQLNKAYITTGSEKELEEKGLLSKEGGFWG
ncbi:MAG: hypothetical protein HC906_10315 [Bacteroidales bacterium]|nr:hypothetical protein [Bacteroidales bacterium]